MKVFLETLENLLREGKKEEALKLVKEKSKGKEDRFAEILIILGTSMFHDDTSLKEKIENIKVTNIEIEEDEEREVNRPPYVIREDNKIENIKIGIDCYKLAYDIARDTQLHSEIRKILIILYEGLIPNLIKRKRYNEAEKILQDIIIKINPNDVWTYINIATCCFSTGKMLEAKIAAKNAREIAFKKPAELGHLIPDLDYFYGAMCYVDGELDYAKNAFISAKTGIKKIINSIKLRSNDYPMYNARVDECDGLIHLIEAKISWNKLLYASAMENFIIAQQYFNKIYFCEALDYILTLQELLKLDEQLFNLIENPSEILVETLPHLVKKTQELIKNNRHELLISYYHYLDAFNQSLDILRSDKEQVKINLKELRKAKSIFVREKFKPGIKLAEKIEPFISKTIKISEEVKSKSKEEKEKIINDFWLVLDSSKAEILKSFDGTSLRDMATKLTKLENLLIPSIPRIEETIIDVGEKQEKLLELKDIWVSKRSVDNIIEKLQKRRPTTKQRILWCFKDEKELQTKEVKNKVATIFEKEYCRETISKNLSELSSEKWGLLERIGRGSNTKYKLKPSGKEVILDQMFKV